MRLKKHREDVADLRLMGDNYVQEIARRYLNLIRMAESSLPYFQSIGLLIKEDRRVLKDSEVKK
jgi:hypothetical protein